MAQAQTAKPESPTALTETYGNWVVRCTPPAAEEGKAAPARVCEMTQELRQKADNQRLLTVGLQASDAGATLTVVAPFGLLLSQDIKIEVGGKQIVAAPFRTCLPGGCIATSWLDATAIAAFAAGSEAVVVMTSTSRQQLRVTVSLNGFSAALKRLRAL